MACPAGDSTLSDRPCAIQTASAQLRTDILVTMESRECPVSGVLCFGTYLACVESHARHLRVTGENLEAAATRHGLPSAGRLTERVPDTDPKHKHALQCVHSALPWHQPQPFPFFYGGGQAVPVSPRTQHLFNQGYYIPVRPLRGRNLGTGIWKQHGSGRSKRRTRMGPVSQQQPRRQHEPGGFTRDPDSLSLLLFRRHPEIRLSLFVRYLGPQRTLHLRARAGVAYRHHRTWEGINPGKEVWYATAAYREG
ncbi:hypothetical protein VTI74DRAFT_5266 [Chaetomium olivicolor]